MAKKFFYVSGGLLMLALAYHVGATSAQSQVGGQVIGFSAGGDVMVMAQTGDCYYRRTQVGAYSSQVFDPGTPAVLMGNFWGSGPTSTSQQSWGQVKARYR